MAWIVCMRDESTAYVVGNDPNDVALAEDASCAQQHASWQEASDIAKRLEETHMYWPTILWRPRLVARPVKDPASSFFPFFPPFILPLWTSIVSGLQLVSVLGLLFLVPRLAMLIGCVFGCMFGCIWTRFCRLCRVGGEDAASAIIRARVRALFEDPFVSVPTGFVDFYVMLFNVVAIAALFVVSRPGGASEDMAVALRKRTCSPARSGMGSGTELGLVLAKVLVSWGACLPGRRRRERGSGLEAPMFHASELFSA